MVQFYFMKYTLCTIHGKCKTEFAAARLDKYKKYHASPAVLSLETHESAPLFTAIMRGKYCDPLLAVSPSVSSMFSFVVMTIRYASKFLLNRSTINYYHSRTITRGGLE